MESGQTKIMGIINLNEDSFYAPSRAASADAFRRRADALLEAGADILDLGPMSSRPGAVLVDAEEEWARLEPVAEAAARHYPDITFSIDTFRATIVLRAYQVMGRFWINDISSGEWDEAMLPVAGRLGLRYIAMHHQGDFTTMHQPYQYADVVAGVKQYFRVKPLELAQIEAIFDIQAGLLRERLNKQGVALEIKPAARTLLAKRGYDPRFGARPLKRVLVKDLETPLSRMLISGELHEGMVLTVGAKKDGELEFSCTSKG